MTKDIYLDADGHVVTDPRKAVKMRRTVLDENGRLVETSTWLVVGAAPRESEPKRKTNGWTPARGL